MSPWWLTTGVPPSKVYGAYNARAASDFNDSLVNRNDPGVDDLTVGVTPAWDASAGWTFSYAEYLKTGKIPVNGMSVIARAEPSTSYYGAIFGAESDASNLDDKYFAHARFVSPNTETALLQFGATAVPSISGSSHVLAMTLSTAGVAAFFADGMLESSGTAVVNTLSHPLFVGANNVTGTASYLFEGSISAIAIYDTELTSDQVQSITVGMLGI